MDKKDISGHLDRATLLIQLRMSNFRCDVPDVETAAPQTFRFRALPRVTDWVRIY